MKDLISTQFNHIKHFTTADEAWAWLQLNFSELLGILSDVHLPNSMSGIELRDKVKTHYPSVNFFLYSGMPKEKIEQQFACKITRNFINKPVNYQDIVRIYSRIHNQK
jgi:DNA-binding NtrC family response regulator